MEGGNAKARFASTGDGRPDLKEGNADITWRVSMRSSRLQVISLQINMPSRKKMDSVLMSVFALLRNAIRRTPIVFGNCKSRHMVGGMRNYLFNAVVSLAKVGLQFRFFSFDPWPYIVSRKNGGAAGAITTHIDDILGRGEPGVLAENRVFLGQRLGAMKVQELSSVNVGMAAPQ